MESAKHNIINLDRIFGNHSCISRLGYPAGAPGFLQKVGSGKGAMPIRLAQDRREGVAAAQRGDCAGLMGNDDELQFYG